MNISNRTLKEMASHINDKKLKELLWKLDEEEARHERWEDEKKRRHEVSLNGNERVVTKIEFELATRKRAFFNGITETDLYCALSNLDNRDIRLIYLLFFYNQSERQVSKLYKCSQNAIHKRKRKVLETLRLLLDE